MFTTRATDASDFRHAHAEIAVGAEYPYRDKLLHFHYQLPNEDHIWYTLHPFQDDTDKDPVKVTVTDIDAARRLPEITVESDETFSAPLWGRGKSVH